MLIAIDGPAGAGKSTAARALAAKLGVPHFDTGAVYRAVAFVVLARGLDPSDPEAGRVCAEALDVVLTPDGVLLDGAAPGPHLRTREVAIAASQISVHLEVRHVLVEKQRKALLSSGGVAEGRDIGTVVAPDADLKFFLTASPRARAARRGNEIAADGTPVDLAELTREIADRDARDADRAVSPLRPADDAIIIDTTDLNADAVLETLVAHTKARTA